MTFRKTGPIYLLFIHLFISPHTKKITRKEERKQLHICARLKTKKKKKPETKELSNHMNNIYEFARPCEQVPMNKFEFPLTETCLLVCQSVTKNNSRTSLR